MSRFDSFTRCISHWFGLKIFVKCAIKPPSNDPYNIHLQVKSKLEKELQNQKVTLEECTDTDPTSVLVFCVVSSRIETDIQDVLESVDKGASIMLVILHYTLPSQLKGDLADEDCLLEDAYHRQLLEEKRITHFAFHDSYGGLYDHEQNTLGMKKLVDMFMRMNNDKGTVKK